MTTLKFCKDCKNHAGHAICYKDVYKHINLVTGGPDYHRKTKCVVERMGCFYDGCGKEAKYFEPKLVEPTKWQRLVQFLTSSDKKPMGETV